MDRRTVIAAALGCVLLAVTLAGTGCVRKPLPESWRIDTRLGEQPSGSGEGAGAKRASVETVELGTATDANVALTMGVGELQVSSNDTSALAQASFTYGDPGWKPEVSYSVEGTTGTLEIDQPEIHLKLGADAANSWDVRLAKGVPTNLSVHIGAGTSDLDLSEIDVRDLSMRLGAGETTVDLTGPRMSDVKGDIQAGIGELTVKLPKDVGVRVVGSNTGIGDFQADGFKVDGDAYVNDAYGTSPVTIELTVMRGVGEVNLELE